MFYVRKLEDITKSYAPDVDCFVSASIAQLVSVVQPLNGTVTDAKDLHEGTLFEGYDPRAERRRLIVRPGLLVDMIEIPVSESRQRTHDVGFIPMSKLRVYNPHHHIAKLAELHRLVRDAKHYAAFMNRYEGQIFIG
jgi:hypothetical protein